MSARSLASVGEPRSLSQCGGWILVRQIPGSRSHDALGVYPLFSCREWQRLPRDLQELQGSIVSLALVVDPFSGVTENELRRSFRDVVMPFKEHYVLDFQRPRPPLGRAHRRATRKAYRQVDVRLCDRPIEIGPDWVDLYSQLIVRHEIRGVAAFEPQALLDQLRVPGLVAFRAEHGGRTVSIQLWFVQEDVAFYHLGASSPEGYEHGASYALVDTAIEHFESRGQRYLDLGGGAGLERVSADGLSRFKSGWTNCHRPAYFCGRIFDAEAYDRLTRGRGVGRTSYFPAYRQGTVATENEASPVDPD